MGEEEDGERKEHMMAGLKTEAAATARAAAAKAARVAAAAAVADAVDSVALKKKGNNKKTKH